MVSPILLYLKSHKGENADSMIKRIIRATYQFEIYQYAKKKYKSSKN